MAKQPTKKEIHIKILNQATKVARNSLVILACLTLIKAFGGYATNIISLTGDALGSFADIIATSAIFIGLRLSQKRETETFKYGYHRVETLITLIVSIVIIYGGQKILDESVHRLFLKAQTGAHTIGVITSSISIVVSLFAFLYQRTIAEKLNSTAMRASAYDKRNDTFVSLGVLTSVLADKFNVPYVEGSVGILISIIILWTGFKYGKDALLYLLDYWDAPEITNQIRLILEKSKIVTAVKNIRLRHVGTYIFGEAFLEINPFADSKDLRDELRRLNKNVEDNVEHLGNLVLYIDPPKPAVIRVAIPIVEEIGLKSRIAETPDIPFRFFFVEIRYGGIQKFYSVPKIFKTNQVSEITEFLKSQQTNILISSLIGPLLYYNLRLNNIKVYPHFLEIKDVENTVKLLLLDI